MNIKRISTKIGKQFVREHHYATISPPITKTTIGLFHEDELVGVSLWGYGVRPQHTIRKMFPSLAGKNYLELNRLCVLDSMPRNTESQFISMCVSAIKADFPDVKLLFSWADGLRGKPGYIYQASNWLYGGHIWSEFYITNKGEVVHPRLLITRYGTRKKSVAMNELGLSRIRGYQFRYCLFVCSRGERKRLITESPYAWNTNYPKTKDLRWTIEDSAAKESREIRELPKLKGSGQFRLAALRDIQQQRETLFDEIERSVNDSSYKPNKEVHQLRTRKAPQ